MNEIIREFLLETHEGLAQFDLDMVTLEKEPKDSETLARAFRTLHTIKGSTGFLGFKKLQAVGHSSESLLSRLRSGELTFNADIASTLLSVVDTIRRRLASIEQTEDEGDGDDADLIEALEILKNSGTLGARACIEAAPGPDEPAESLGIGPEHCLAAVDQPPSGVDALANFPAQGSDKNNGQDSPQSVTAVPSPMSQPLAAEPLEFRASAVSDSAIRVDVGLLDKLMTLVGELVLARNQIMQFSTYQEDAPFLGAVQRLNLLTTELQANVMKTRMQPIGNIWNKFPRVVRDLAVACGKRASIELEGRETELDKTIIEAIRDPLVHLLRNAIDHGLEAPEERVARGKPAEGRVSLHAFHEGGKVIIEMTDDGKGIDSHRVREKAILANLITADQASRLGDRELVNLIFLPGFSTTDRVTHFSGRGVGMDVVRTNVEKIGGTVDIESRLGHGTTVKMKIPLTLAIIPALTVTAGGDRFAIPQVSLLELVRLDAEQAPRRIELIQGMPVYRRRGQLLPLVYLDRDLGIDGGGAEGGEVNIVVLQADDRQFGLVVDSIHDTEEIVVKPLQKQLKGINAFSGATIMGDGRVALILDVLGIAQRAHVVSATRERILSEKTPSTASPAGDLQVVLLCVTRDGGRLAIPLSLVARLEVFAREALEQVGTQVVVQYRDEILPLIDVGRALRRLARGTREGRTVTRQGAVRLPVPGDDDAVHVVVYSREDQRVGLVVGRILDIVEVPIASRSRSNRPGVLFTTVVQERVTEFLDVEGVIRSALPGVFETPGIISVEA